MEKKFNNALVSVSDKSGLLEFIKPLADSGTRIVSTGGTARALRDAGVDVVDVSEQTGFAEVMDGRVKTLHPNVHMALLGRDGHEGDLQTLKDNGLEPFDLVVGNLYPFEQNLDSTKSDSELVEFIDIGGPSFLRAAAKNFQRITVVCDPSDYRDILEAENTLARRKAFAAKLYQHTGSYDAMIAAALEEETTLSPWHAIGGHRVQTLRYGENPQQQAGWYRLRGGGNGLQSAEIIQGKALSYNNLLDLDSAARAVMDFATPSCVALKHNNPCGIAVGTEMADVVQRAIQADPVSVFGGIVAVRGEVDAPSAETMTEVFLECVVASSYSDEALEILAKKKNLRVLKWAGLSAEPQDHMQVRSILGGYLLQTPDSSREELRDLDIKVHRDDWSEDLLKNVELAWKAVTHLKSNAIAIASDGQTVGMGMGQVNRVDAVRQAVERMQEFHPGAQNLVLASDAFFPFPDSVEFAAQAGIRWVVQPGGSIRDQDVINRAKELEIGLIFTGVRHFRH